MGFLVNNCLLATSVKQSVCTSDKSRKDVLSQFERKRTKREDNVRFVFLVSGWEIACYINTMDSPPRVFESYKIRINTLANIQSNK